MVPGTLASLSNIFEAAWYEEFPSFWDDPLLRKWNLWGYIDQQDVALSCRLALEADADAVGPASSFIIAAPDRDEPAFG